MSAALTAGAEACGDNILPVDDSVPGLDIRGSYLNDGG